MLENKNRELAKQLQAQQVHSLPIPMVHFGADDFNFRANKLVGPSFGLGALGPSAASVGASTQASITPPKHKKEGIGLLFETMRMTRDDKEILKAFSKFKVASVHLGPSHGAES